MRLLRGLGCLLLVLSSGANAQHYDPFFVLPGPTGRLSADAGLYNRDIGDVTDASTVLVMGKYCVTDEFETGVAVDLGILDEDAGTMSQIRTGIKFGLAPDLAVTGTVLLPVGDVDDLGVAVGVMKSINLQGTTVNTWARGAFLSGYAADGMALSLLVEPSLGFGDYATGYLDVMIASNTDAFADQLAIDLGPNVDINFSETAIINAGLTIGLAGDVRQDDIGVGVSLVTAF